MPFQILVFVDEFYKYEQTIERTNKIKKKKSIQFVSFIYSLGLPVAKLA